MPIGFQPTVEFADWAVGWAGINGGNPAGRLWVCGLEFGTGQKTPQIDRSRERYYVDGIPAFSAAFMQEHGDEIQTSAFLGKLAKVVLAFEGRDIGGYREFLRSGLLSPQGPAFHLNLYPMPFKDMEGRNWTPAHMKVTGFANKLLYRAWCMQHRFPWLAQRVRDASPKVLICTGSSYADDFRAAFCDDPFQKPRTWSIGQKHVDEHLINEGRTRLLITPFLGQGGLMSNDDLRALGERAAAHTA